MNMGDLRGLLTVVLLILFIALWAWTWSRTHKKKFEEAARLPLEDDEVAPRQDTGERVK